MSSLCALAGDGFIVRFELKNGIKEYLRDQQYDITGINLAENHIEAYLTQEQFDLIQSQKFKIDFSFPTHLSKAPDREYKNPEEIEDFLKDIHGRFPELTELRSIGKTIEGRTIWAIKITAPSENQKSVLFVNGMHHAREVMTPEITTDVVEYLVTRFGSDQKVQQWLEQTIVWVIPMFNLDGNNKMWNVDSMWRKNTRDGHGVDINRNYPTAWDTCNGSSGSSWAQDYRGEFPASEPETQAMMNFVASIKPVFSISYHSYSEIVIYPFGCSPKKTPEHEAVESIGTELGAKLDYRPGTSWELLYNVDGGDIDWLYTEHQVLPYVVEVNSTRQGFHPSYSEWRDVTVKRNRPGWMFLLDRLQGPSIQGKVNLDEFREINIALAKDSKVFQNYKINIDGSFHVILKPETYEITFSGNKSKIIKNLKIDSKKEIIL